ncbi:unnamed protein product [Lymnaea stagnalis]|uniref:Peptidase S1 domain-containing protein n=1 Tax=Lymnaea stagnalis TaxID=6523 RepID=A0AAV2HQF8_LYMST
MTTPTTRTSTTATPTTRTSTSTTTTPTTRTSTTATSSSTSTTAPTVTTPSNQECGASLAHRKKVINGVDATECQFPWVAHVTGQNDGQIYCGGSIIDSRHVITAAHCLRNRKTGQIASPSMVNVSVGSSNRTRLTTVQVSAIIMDPRYNSATKDYDTAILRLDNALTFSDCVQPICLPSVTDDPAAADFCEVAGWGLTIYGNNTSEATILQHVELPLVDQQRCQNSYFTGPETINELKLCAGDYYQGGRDTCSGDSGGPLMCLSKGRYFLYGVTSFGKYCGFRYYPGVYARVNHPSILDFINSVRSS